MNYKSVIILISNQNLLIENFIAELKSKISSDESQIFFTSYHFEDTSLDEILTNAKTPSMFHKKKLILIKNIDTKKCKPLLEEIIKDDTGFLTTVITTDKDAKVFSKFKDNISILNLDSNSKFDVLVREEAIKLGLSLSPKSIKTLISLLGENLNIISNELEKISASNIGSEVSEKDITEHIQKQSYDNSYSLLSTIARKDIKSSLKVLSELEKNKEDPIGIVSLLSWRTRQIFKLLELTKENKSTEEMAKYLKTSKGAVYYILKDSKNFRITELGEMLRLISDADLKLKSSRENNFLILSKLIINICKT